MWPTHLRRWLARNRSSLTVGPARYRIFWTLVSRIAVQRLRRAGSRHPATRDLVLFLRRERAFPCRKVQCLTRKRNGMRPTMVLLCRFDEQKYGLGRGGINPDGMLRLTMKVGNSGRHFFLMDSRLDPLTVSSDRAWPRPILWQRYPYFLLSASFLGIWFPIVASCFPCRLSFLSVPLALTLG